MYMQMFLKDKFHFQISISKPPKTLQDIFCDRNIQDKNG